MYAGVKEAVANIDAADIVDFRSDTVTRPDAGMQAAMADAAVGDDVFGEDPTVNRLQDMAAQMLGKDAGLLFPSGTQSNLAAIMAHCGRGEEYIVGRTYHAYKYEAGGVGVLGSVWPCPLDVEPDGSLSAEAVGAAIKPDDSHFPITRLLCLENTTYGQAIPLPLLAEPVAVARKAGLSLHLDGARFFNAITKLNIEPIALAELFDTISICLSKGLGAPVGTVLVGPKEVIGRAHRLRKMLGGGMRQAGVFASAGLYALTENVTSLADDHRRAVTLAENLRDLPALDVEHTDLQTNMVFLTPRNEDWQPLQHYTRDRGILLGGGSPTIRLVMHRDIDDSKLGRAIDTITAFYRN